MHGLKNMTVMINHSLRNVLGFAPKENFRILSYISKSFQQNRTAKKKTISSRHDANSTI